MKGLQFLKDQPAGVRAGLVAAAAEDLLNAALNDGDVWIPERNREQSPFSMDAVRTELGNEILAYLRAHGVNATLDGDEWKLSLTIESESAPQAAAQSPADLPITFEWEGVTYTVDQTVYDCDLPIVLPNGRVLVVANGWIETVPPKPRGLEEFQHGLLSDATLGGYLPAPHLVADFVAKRVNGVVATIKA